MGPAPALSSSPSVFSQAGRDPIDRIHLLEDHEEAYDIWKTAGVRNRILVHFDGHIDFHWIQDRSPEELLRVGSLAELHHLLSQVKEWNLDQRSLRESIHSGNFIYPALKEGIIREFYWVVPDPFWTDAKARKVLYTELLKMVRSRPSEARMMRATEEEIHLKIFHSPVSVCPVGNLPRFAEPVLLDIDIDYFVTWAPEELRPPPYFDLRPVSPWLGCSGFMERLKKLTIPTDLVTLAYSVKGGYTPLRYKYFGEVLYRALSNPSLEVEDEPAFGTQAEAYRIAWNALRDQDEPLARRWWARMKALDPSYRNVWAIPGWREERAGRLPSALEIYEKMIRIDPGWHIPHLGKGRVLWRLRHFLEAEKALQKALDLVQGSTEPTTVYHWMGFAAFRRGDQEQARRYWIKAVDKNPRDGLAWHGLARLAFENGDHEKTIQYGNRCAMLADSAAIHKLMFISAWRRRAREIFWREFRLWIRLSFQEFMIFFTSWPKTIWGILRSKLHDTKASQARP